MRSEEDLQQISRAIELDVLLDLLIGKDIIIKKELNDGIINYVNGMGDTELKKDLSIYLNIPENIKQKSK